MVFGLSFAPFNSFAQTMYVPSGTSGIGSSSNSSVGINTNSPTALLQVGVNDANQTFKVGVVGNMANSNAVIKSSLAVLGIDAYNIGEVGAVAWNYYNAGSSPSWSGSILRHYGTSYSGNVYGLTAANQGTLVFQNVSNGVIASNGANFHIAPFGTVSASFLWTGNVGIGTTSPGTKLELKGDELRVRSIVSKTDTTGRGLLRLTRDDTVGTNNLEMLFTRQGATSGGSRYGQIQVGNNGYYWASLILNPNGGNVGIGTTNPTQRLSVNGTVEANEVVVDTGWLDYVFENRYRLAPLDEIAAYIEVKKHLPEVPSTRENVDRGVSLGQMQSTLLEKVEEPTLHHIAQEKRVRRVETGNQLPRSIIAGLPINRSQMKSCSYITHYST